VDGPPPAPQEQSLTHNTHLRPARRATGLPGDDVWDTSTEQVGGRVVTGGGRAFPGALRSSSACEGTGELVLEV
jgi:hypothetical protein